MISEEWLYKNFVTEFFEIDVSNYYESVREVYRTGLSGSFLATIINGVLTPARFHSEPGEHKYTALIRHMGNHFDIEEASLFYFGSIDYSVGELKIIKEFQNRELLVHPLTPLNYFELEQYQPQNGPSWLGLIAEDCSWLLLHEYDPGQHFAIRFCSTKESVDSLVRSLGDSDNIEIKH